MNNKPNQHYVWQKYLEPWLKDGQIICLRNKKDIILTNPRNIASQRYFYTINSVTYNDCQRIRQLVIGGMSEPMKDLLHGWMEPIEEHLSEYHRYLEGGGKKNAIEGLKEQLLNNILEEVHMRIEQDGLLGLCKVQSGDLAFLSERNDKDEMVVNFILYLSFQYFRTKRIKQSVKEKLGEHISLFNNFDDAFNIMAVLYSTIFGNSIYELIKNNEFYCYFIKNLTATPFITGDQPVINIHAVLSDEPSELSLYYPLSPTTALLVTKEKDCITECSVERVKEYNDLIEQQSLELIFAGEASELYQFKQESSRAVTGGVEYE